MEPTNVNQLLDLLSAQRVENAGLHEAMLAAILRNLSPDDAARVQAIVQEFTDREAELQAAIATSEQQVKEAVLATGATAEGTYLQALIMAPRITWDNKAIDLLRIFAIAVAACGMVDRISPDRKWGVMSTPITPEGMAWRIGFVIDVDLLDVQFHDLHNVYALSCVTHTQTDICGAVQQWRGPERFHDTTNPQTHTINA